MKATYTARVEGRFFDEAMGDAAKEAAGYFGCQESSLDLVAADAQTYEYTIEEDEFASVEVRSSVLLATFSLDVGW